METKLKPNPGLFLSYFEQLGPVFLIYTFENVNNIFPILHLISNPIVMNLEAYCFTLL